MTQQQLLQAARNVLTATQTDTGRSGLQKAALAAGRKAEAVSKASTMRLALWVSKGTSAIWLSVTGGLTQPPIPATLHLFLRHPMDNYFNSSIISRHDDHMYLNSMMAEHYDFCLNLPWSSEADKAWNYDMKKAHLCYDVWLIILPLTRLISTVMLSLC